MRQCGWMAMALAAVAFLVLNLLTPEYHDDFVYKFMFEDGGVNYGHPIRSLGDIFFSQVDHYGSVNGRSIVHVLVQLCTGLLGKSVFNILNVIVFGAFIWLLSRNVGRCNHLPVSVFVITLVLLLPRFKDTFLWMTGSINYLWSATAVLLYLLAYDQRHDRPWDRSLPLLLVASLLIGWTHEGITLPLAAALLIINLLTLKKTRGRQQGLWLALALMAGACIVVFAPSTIARSHNAGGFTPSGLALKFITGLTVMSRLKIVYLMLSASAVACLMDRDTFKQVIARDGYLLLAALLSLGIVFASGMESTRTAFGLELFSMVFLLRLAGAWLARHGMVPQLRWCGIALAAGLVIFYSLLLSHVVPSWQESRRLVSQIERTTDGIIGTSEHKAGLFSSYVCTMLSPDSTVRAMNYDPHGWPASIAATYHRDSLIFLPRAFLDDLRARPERYDSLSMDTPYEFYVRHIAREAVIDSVTIRLAPNDFSDIPVLLRPIARQMKRYTTTCVTTSSWVILTLDGRRYLFIKKDRSLVRRLRAIDLHPAQ